MEKTETDCWTRHFEKFRRNIVGIDALIHTPYGEKKLIYTDWTASGRLYEPIEKKIVEIFGPYLANTHTETSFTGNFMTRAYHEAIHIIKKHVKAPGDYVLIQAGYGMTGAIQKLQRILALKVHEQYRDAIRSNLKNIPLVFVSSLEHHSNHISWLETVADVKLIPFDETGMPDLNAYEDMLKQYAGCPLFLSISACSNVTGIQPPVADFIRLTKQYGGKVFVDYACSAPYVNMDLSVPDEIRPDAIVFSPHKFLGGPGTGGILIMHKDLYHNRIPDEPGGGTVVWTDPWEGAVYLDDIEARETGGTPGFLLAIKTALAIRLKEQMNVEKIQEREHYLAVKFMDGLSAMDGIRLLEARHKERLGVFSLVADKLPYQLMERLLNDLFGIQARGGCSCAGTYGHYLFGLDREKSKRLKNQVLNNHPELKPGWTRVSIHPTTTVEEIEKVLEALDYILKKGLEIARRDYKQENGEFYHREYRYRFKPDIFNL